MQAPVVQFVTDSRFVRRQREQRTLAAMIGMYCEAHHFRRGLCADCADLGAYAERRLQRCVFGDAKPTCANCVVHCYRDDMRERVRAIMRWAGPRMLARHPILALRHVLDGRRASPRLPAARGAEG